MLRYYIKPESRSHLPMIRVRGQQEYLKSKSGKKSQWEATRRGHKKKQKLSRCLLAINYRK